MTLTEQDQLSKQEIAQLEADDLLHISGTRRAWHEFRRNRFALAGSVFIIFIALMGTFAPVVSTHDPYKQSLRKRMKSPSAEHWLGTDELGRDFYSRLAYGARVSLFVGIVGTAAGVISGTIIGLISGFFGGQTDTLVMRVIDVMYAFPGIVLAILVVAVMGPSLFNLIVVLAIWATPTLSRIVRGNVLSLKEQDYMCKRRGLLAPAASELCSSIFCPIPWRRSSSIRPSSVAGAILTTAALWVFSAWVYSRPQAEWGNILSNGRQLSAQSAAADDLPGGADLLDSDLDQFDRRCAARCPGSIYTVRDANFGSLV